MDSFCSLYVLDTVGRFLLFTALYENIANERMDIPIREYIIRTQFILLTPTRGTSRIDNPQTPSPNPCIKEMMAAFAPGLFLIY